MAEKITIYILDGSTHPMITVRANVKKGAKYATAEQVGKVFLTKDKTSDAVKAELAGIIFGNSDIITNWYHGKLTLKQKLAAKYGTDAGGQLFRMMAKVQNQNRAIATLKTQLSKHDAGCICEQCGTYHQQGAKNLVVDSENRVFCNFGCRDQYAANSQLQNEIDEMMTVET